MRLLIAALLLAVPGLVAAQPARPPAETSASAHQPAPRPRPKPAPPPAPPASQGSTLPPIGLPLPPIGLPLPPIGLAPATPPPTQSQPDAPGFGRRRLGGDRRRGRTAPPVIYVAPAYGWATTSPGAPADTTPTSPAAPAPPPAVTPTATGTLHLDLQPHPTGQLFVDGVYVGTLDQLGTDLTFAAGTRHLEIRERGYQPFVLAVQIVDGRDLVYRGVLTRDTPPSPAKASPPTPTPVAAPARKPFYFIPGCYLGDVPPNEAKLPPTCDLSRAVTFRP